MDEHVARTNIIEVNSADSFNNNNNNIKNNLDSYNNDDNPLGNNIITDVDNNSFGLKLNNNFNSNYINNNNNDNNFNNIQHPQITEDFFEGNTR